MKNSFLILAFLCLNACTFAQETLVEQNFLDQAIEYIRESSELFPPKNPTFDRVRTSLETKLVLDDGKEMSGGSEDNFGFGFKRFYYERPGAYCSVYANGYALNNDFARYRLGINCDEEVWKSIREALIKAWKDNGGPQFKEEKSGLFVETSNEEVVQKYKKAVSGTLGRLKTVAVPSALERYYQYLIDPMTNSTIGIGPCTSGNKIPEGKISIDQFIVSKRTDLLENILRGYNPGGRIYGALALRKLERSGVKLEPATLEAIEKVVNLDSRIDFCRGVKVSNHSGGEILKLVNF